MHEKAKIKHKKQQLSMNKQKLSMIKRKLRVKIYKKRESKKIETKMAAQKTKIKPTSKTRSKN